MDPMRTFTSSMHELLGVTILPLHGLYDKVSPSPPTSMHPRRIAIPTSQEPRMAILQECIEVGKEDDTSSCIPGSRRMVTLSNLCMNEVNVLKVRGLRWCDTH
jgi:hypothetical protein